MAALVIIGNGFDLAHGLKTGYSQFIKYLIELQLADPDLEPMVFDIKVVKKYNDKVIPKYRFSFDNYEQIINSFKEGQVKIELIKNRFLFYILNDIALKNWCDLEEAYFRLLQKNISGAKGVKKLNEDFEIIKNYLGSYLQKEEESQELSPNPAYASFFKNLSPDSLILNFNYTNTLDLYKEEIKETSILHIHGKLNEVENPIIFGYAANDEESRALSNKNNNELLRNIKKHCYKRANSERRLKDFISFPNSLNVFTFGHSFGGSDKLILNTILNHKHTNSIRVFYYERYESYFQMQANIDRVMINDTNFEKLINFQDSHRMPQKADSPKQQSIFTSYIENLGYENL